MVIIKGNPFYIEEDQLDLDELLEDVRQVDNDINDYILNGLEGRLLETSIMRVRVKLLTDIYFKMFISYEPKLINDEGFPEYASDKVLYNQVLFELRFNGILRFSYFFKDFLEKAKDPSTDTLEIVTEAIDYINSQVDKRLKNSNGTLVIEESENN